MALTTFAGAGRPAAVDRLWFTRCPVPTATGLAFRLGWLQEEFAPDGIVVASLQEAPAGSRHHHYTHSLPTLIREGGSLLALAARAQEARTRLVGLTWIEEGQVILVRPDSSIRAPADLRGARVALPAWVQREQASQVRGWSIARGMTLQGLKGALAHAGLGLEAVRFVEVASGDGAGTLWRGLEHLARGEVDAVYAKGASAVEAARALGAVVGIDLDALPDRRHRVNNGTPRPITVHEDLLRDHPDLVVRFLAQTLRAADWAADHLPEVRQVLEGETRAGAQGVASAYRDGFHRSLYPDLSPERLALFEVQKDFTLLHGILDRDLDLQAWAAPEPLRAARRLLLERGAPDRRTA